MALALYRRYRPDTFDGVIGQDQVTVPLSRALDQNRLTHAYLFSGPRGCGKTSSARILARCVNCAKGPTSHPCGECPSCKDLATGGPGSIDVVEIDAASHNGVDDARELRERAGFAPARDRYKIFILDEAHMVTQQGFNALLKIVEEPPEHVMFIFATTEPDKVIGTIRSRTHHYPFRLVPPEIMGPYLEGICEKEQIKPEPGVLKLAMRAGGGSVRDTLSVLDQLMVGSEHGVISHDAAVALLGFTPDSLIGEAIDAIIDRNGEQLYGVVQKVVVGGFEPRRFVEDLLARVRDLLVLTLGGDRAESVLSDDAAVEDIADLHRQASALGLRSLTSIADTINDTLGTMSGATSPRMRLELLAARLLAGREENVFGPASTSASATASGAPGSSAAPAQQQNGNAPRRGGFIDSTRNKRNMQAQFAGQHQTAMPQTGDSGVPGAAAQQAPSTAAASDHASAGTQTPAMAPSAGDNQASQPGNSPAQAGPAPQDAASVEERWQAVLNKLPSDIREYVDHPRVPSVRLITGPAGKSKLLMTFAKPIDQHAFALAVSSDEAHDGKKAAVVVQDAVKEIFGEGARISPTPTAANGETVESIRRMSPEQVSQVKREIALAKAKQSAATLAAVTVGMHAGSTGKEAKTPGSSDNAQDADDPSHRGRGSVPAAAAMTPTATMTPAAGTAGLSPSIPADAAFADDDPWMQPLPVNKQTTGHGPASPAHAEASQSADDGQSAVQPHHGKHVAVPDISDGIDPWAVPATPVAPVMSVSPDAPIPPTDAHKPASSPTTGQQSSNNNNQTQTTPQDDPWMPLQADGNEAEDSAHIADAHTPEPQDYPEPVEPQDDPWAQQPDDFGSRDMSPQPGTPDSPQVPPEEDEYSLNDESLGTATGLSVEELKELFEVKKIEQFAPDDPKNPKNLQPPNRHNSMDASSQK
ncbi:DNA polymerase III subunit gamma/tau [Bifidobacterium apri]|uniref:DNA-directed DNA polymerase n=1 Tax=Bifidobacterium apri TaxID=1769423 RepID=A0A6A2V912_9BIFI|nr:DNA polymerase III subunit gamma/tau [Bifidobacterium apri]KAB8299460.1 DNA polymerase III subunit gamma/tau [Bifidobacterium apri]